MKKFSASCLLFLEIICGLTSSKCLPHMPLSAGQGAVEKAAVSLDASRFCQRLGHAALLCLSGATADRSSFVDQKADLFLDSEVGSE